MKSPFSYDHFGTIVKTPEKPVKNKKRAAVVVEEKSSLKADKIVVETVKQPMPEFRKKVMNLTASPHLLDLTPFMNLPRKLMEEKSIDGKLGSAELKSESRHRQPFITDGNHERDMSNRSISVRPTGWRDFPPPDARTMSEAVSLTLGRFLRQHPLASLGRIAFFSAVLATLGYILSRPFVATRSAIRRIVDLVKLPERTRIIVAPKPAQETMRVQVKTPAPAKQKAKKTLGFRNKWAVLTPVHYAAATLIVALPIVAVPMVRGQVAAIEREAQNGFSDLLAAGEAVQTRDFDGARLSFQAASLDFAEAERRLGLIGGLVSNVARILPIPTRASAAAPALAAGRELALGGSLLSAGLATLDSAGDPMAKIAALKKSLNDSMPHIDQAAASIAAIDSAVVPEEFRGRFMMAQTETPKLVDTLRRATKVAAILPAIAGADAPKRYLVVFQNSTELRPTGGFVGGYALLDIDRGQVKNVEIPGGGSYDLKGSLRLNLAAPQPLRLINPRWQFQDANWSPDFPTSAQTLTRFYEQSGGPTTDGVIAMNESLIERMLEVLGPIELAKYGKTIDAKNFYPEIQKQVELDYDKTENKPKQILADMAPTLLTRLFAANQETLMKLAGVLDEAVAIRDLQFWMRDESLQADVASLGWSGELKQTEGDYLNIVHTNIAGQKTDAVMADTVDHSVKILADGSGIVTLTLKRAHNGQKGDLFSGVRNVDYLRVYVPRGSELVEAAGFEKPDPKLFKIPAADLATDQAIADQENSAVVDRASGTTTSEESGKTVFANWVQTDPGATSDIQLTYRLPLGAVELREQPADRLADLRAALRLPAKATPGRLTYSLLVQKQSGLAPITFNSNLETPRGSRTVWSSPSSGPEAASTIIDRDIFLSSIIELP